MDGTAGSLDPAAAQRVRGIASGAVFAGAFGGAWLLWGLLSADVATPLPLAALGACCLGLVFLAVRLGRSAPGPDKRDARVRRGFLIVNLVQWATIVAAVAALNVIGRTDLVPAAISIVVALHFLPLIRLFGQPIYYATSAAMLAIDAACLLVGGDRGVIGVMLGSGAVLWATAASQLARGWRLRVRPA